MNNATGSGLKQIIVTGSAGRASVATMIAAMLHACGERVVHLNGHWLHSPLERLALDGKPVERETVEAILGATGGPLGAAGLDEVVDRVLEESGAGWLVVSGAPARAANAAQIVIAPVLQSPDASAAEHAAALIRDLPAAASIVSAPQRESVLDVLRPAFPSMVEVAQSCRLARERFDLDGQAFRLKTHEAEYRLHLPVLGAFQIENAATAILAIEQLRPLGVGLDPGAARTALDGLRLPGRLEVIKRRPLVIVDSGAVVAAVRRGAEALRELISGRRLQIILDPSQNLDPEATIQAVATLHPEIVVAAAAVAPDWAEAARAADLTLRTATGVAVAVDLALSAADPGETIAVFGSRAAAAAARAHVLGLIPDDLRLN